MTFNLNNENIQVISYLYEGCILLNETIQGCITICLFVQLWV